MSRSWLVEPKAYVYWNQKPHFLLDRDMYSNWTLFAVEQGKFQYDMEGREGEAEFGDIVVCPPETWFGRKTVTPLTFHFVQFVWEEEPSEAERELLTGKLSVIDRTRLVSTYGYMRQLGEHCRAGVPADRSLVHMLNDIWHLIGRELQGGVPAGSEPSDPLMEQARRWLLDHAYTPFAMNLLSARLGLTPVQLTRRFRASYLMTPSEFLTALRLERVSRLLRETKLPLDAVAGQCGYENGFYLSRVFRKKKGMNPSQYRKLHQV